MAAKRQTMAAIVTAIVSVSLTEDASFVLLLCFRSRSDSVGLLGLGFNLVGSGRFDFFVFGTAHGDYRQ